MKYQTFPPPPSLAAWVQYFWALEGKASEASPYVHRAMASACPELVFHIYGKFVEIAANGRRQASFMAGVQGPSTHYRRFETREAFSLFGAYLYPFALPRLFGLPITLLRDQMPDLSSLLGAGVDECTRQILAAPDTEYRLQVLSQFLINQLAAQSAPLPAIVMAMQDIMRERGTLKVEILAAQNQLSRRQFERNFKRFSGFNPKLFSRIVRFQSSLSAYGRPNLKLVEVAYEHGYYDQSHFIHEFKAFSGLHPRQFFFKAGEANAWREGDKQ